MARKLWTYIYNDLFTLNLNRMSKAVKKKSATKKNKLGVKNSLVNNINARKKKGISRSRKKSTVSKESYDKMKDNWGEKD